MLALDPPEGRHVDPAAALAERRLEGAQLRVDVRLPAVALARREGPLANDRGVVEGVAQQPASEGLRGANDGLVRGGLLVAIKSGVPAARGELSIS